jgi:uncharacterized membrane protein
MSDSTQQTIHREFELERMILFSDAVFAIAITLLVIEIKFPELPEHGAATVNLFQLFKPTLWQFMAFAISFFFIGASWARHLKMFRYLQAYDDRVIFLNLASLFFIVAFPFSASGLVHARPGFMLPTVIYFGNVSMIFLFNFFLSHYIFKSSKHLSVPGFEAEKKYIYIGNLAFAIGLMFGFVVMILMAVFAGLDQNRLAVVYYIIAFSMFAVRRWTRKFKPKKAAIPS